MTEATLQLIVQALSGPAAAFILLAIVLYAVWKLINRMISAFSLHLTNIEGKFDKLIESLDRRAEKLETDLDDIHEDVRILKRAHKTLMDKLNEKQ